MLWSDLRTPKFVILL